MFFATDCTILRQPEPTSKTQLPKMAIEIHSLTAVLESSIFTQMAKMNYHTFTISLLIKFTRQTDRDCTVF